MHAKDFWVFLKMIDNLVKLCIVSHLKLYSVGHSLLRPGLSNCKILANALELPLELPL